MARKARAGHVTGGRVFGYDNVDVAGAGEKRSHVELRIKTDEAAVVREIFERAADGLGLKTIAKRLNAVGAIAPLGPRSRSRSWAPSSVRDVLRRELYRGRRIWNKTRKRDAWGQKRQRPRPASEWMSVDVEALRIVPEALWHAAHSRMAARAVAYERYRRASLEARQTAAACGSTTS